MMKISLVTKSISLSHSFGREEETDCVVNTTKDCIIEADISCVIAGLHYNCVLIHATLPIDISHFTEPMAQCCHKIVTKICPYRN